MGIIKGIATLAAGALAGAAVYAGVGTFGDGASVPAFDKVGDSTSTAKNVVRFKLAPSSDQLARCMPKVKVNAAVALSTDAKGFDVLDVNLTGAPPATAFTVFLLEVPASPFGAAEYVGDVTTDRKGTGRAELRLIVQEAFSSTLAGDKRVRKELDHVGLWFADPRDDDFCLGAGTGPVTPFDGDGEAGVQAFNSAPSLPEAPLP